MTYSRASRCAKQHHAVCVLLTVVISVTLTGTALGQPVNKSNLWFGGDEGIEVVWKTGKNLAYTEDSPRSMRT